MGSSSGATVEKEADKEYSFTTSDTNLS